MFKRNVPYDALPPLPPQKELETRGVLKALVGAVEAVSTVKEAEKRSPVRFFLPRSLPILESLFSSAMEGVNTTVVKLLEASVLPEAKTDSMTKEAYRYWNALSSALDALKGLPISTRMAENIVSAIRNTPTRVRKTPVTIGPDLDGKVVYTPPFGENTIRQLLGNWEKYVHDQKRPEHPLIKMAVAHYQFEAIHPFADGNGRTGRILNMLMLIDLDVIDSPMIYPSVILLKHKKLYEQLLQGVTERGEWEEWVVFMLGAIQSAAHETMVKILAVESHLLKFVKKARSILPSKTTEKVAEAVFKNPYCRVSDLQVENIGSYPTCARYLKLLADSQLLVRKKIGREVFYVNRELISNLIKATKLLRVER